MTSVTAKPPVLVSFLCPACKAANAINLIALSRAGATSCVACARRLKSSDVSRAIHAPRK